MEKNNAIKLKEKKLFMGKEIRHVDSKKRVVVPPTFKKVMGEEKFGVITNSEETAFLSLYSLKVLEARYLQIKTNSNRKKITANNLKKGKIRLVPVKTIKPNNAKELEMFFYNCHETVELDAQSRITLPESAMKIVGIEINDDVFFEGHGDHIRIFKNEETYNAYYHR